jgi:hypothetical protein
MLFPVLLCHDFVRPTQVRPPDILSCKSLTDGSPPPETELGQDYWKIELHYPFQGFSQFSVASWMTTVASLAVVLVSRYFTMGRIGIGLVMLVAEDAFE